MNIVYLIGFFMNLEIREIDAPLPPPPKYSLMGTFSKFSDCKAEQAEYLRLSPKTATFCVDENVALYYLKGNGAAKYVSHD